MARLEDSIRREVDSKKRVEAMLKSYKDEVQPKAASAILVICVLRAHPPTVLFS